MRTSLLALAVTTTALALSSQPPLAQGDVDQQLGSVHFKTSCNEVAQRRFDRAMRYQHSYWYHNAKELFEEALKADPACGIAQWGVALTLLDNPQSRSRSPTSRPDSSRFRRPRQSAPGPSASATTSMP